jgi:Icc protein
MHECLNRDGISTCKVVAAGAWRLLLLDTWEQGTHGGRLSPAELDFLRERLAALNGYWFLIALHHPPVSIDSPWMDAMGLANPGDFFAIIDACPAVRGVVWGHIHQDFYRCRRGVHLFGTPSTCVQFLPGADHYVRDVRPPGFRELELNADGSLESRIRRCPEANN